jgi:U4/U6 small nuclear ribonucleoprotein PRP31
MEATTTLADSLLDDLDDLMESDDDGDNNDNHNSNGDAPATDESDRCRNDDNVDGEDSKLSSKPSGASSDQKKNGFLDNSSLQRHLKTIRDHAESSAEARSKENEEQNHQLVVQSNKWLASLAEEIGEAHKNLADAYRPKFSELETLLPNIVQYKNAVKIIGNEMDLTKVNDGLDAILTNSQIMTLAVAGSTTSGRPLADDELRNVEALIVYIERLFEVQDELQRFVERSMEALVPSVSTLIGSSIAARLLGLAGGLQELTKIPSCNLSVIGQTKVNADSRAGLSGVSVKQHSGILAESDIVRSVPKSLQKKALKVVAAKLALAIRFDFVNVNTGRPRSAETGLKLKAEVNEKFEKWQEPDKAPTSKALPK